MFFGGAGGIPFGLDDGGMPGMGGMGGRSREPADTSALYDALGITKKASQSEVKKAPRRVRRILGARRGGTSPGPKMGRRDTAPLPRPSGSWR